MRSPATVGRPQMRDFAIAGLFALLAGGMPAGLAVLPQPGSPVAVIAPAWTESAAALRIIAAADGAVLEASANGSVAIAHSDAADFVTRLYQAGAALVLDGAAMSRCLSVGTSGRLFAKRTGT